MSLDLKKYYEKFNVLASMELLETEAFEDFEDAFDEEKDWLLDINLDCFEKLNSDEQFDVLRIFDIYFRNGIPLISDNKYDGFENEYKKEVPESEPIMFEPNVAEWKKHKHMIPMGSLSKCAGIDEIEKWNDKKYIVDSPKVISEKLDGISAELIYKDGKLTDVITRGDGHKGDNITDNAIYFDGVVSEMSTPISCAVRGEVVIEKEKLHIINEYLKEAGKKPLKNTRNGVSGQATKYKDRDIRILENITFIAYELQVFDLKETGEAVV